MRWELHGFAALLAACTAESPEPEVPRHTAPPGETASPPRATAHTAASPTGHTGTASPTGHTGADEATADTGARAVLPFFEDDFSTGDLSRTGGGFAWGMDGDGQLGPNVAVSTLNPYPGDSHSLAFTYPAKPDGADATAEQRFTIGVPGHPEIWLEYWFHLPVNFAHRPQTGPVNNKFLRVWGGDYGGSQLGYLGNNPKAGASYDPRGAGSWLYGQWGDHDNLLFTGQDRPHWDPAWNPGGTSGAIPFGAWSQIRYHFELASAEDAGDGSYELTVDGTSKIHKVDLDFYGDNTNDLRWGYLMGWSNSGFDETTTIHVARFKIWSQDPGW